MGETFELEPLLKAIERAGCGLLDCQQTRILLYDPAREEFSGGLSARLGVWAQAALSQKVVRVDRHGLAVPLTTPEGELMGVLHATGGEFRSEHHELAAALGSLAALAVKRQLLLNAAYEKERLEREMTTAREIISGLLPTVPPSLEGYHLAGWMQPAHLTGGDFYDFLPLDDSRLGFLLADATGHGLHSTLVVAKCRAYLRALLDGRPLSDTAQRLNRLVCQDNVYVTACFGILDLEAHRLHYVSAGQQPLLHYCADTAEVTLLSVTGPPLGIEESLSPEVSEPVNLGPGDLFVLTSDGFPEWRSGDGEFYGEERMQQVIRYCHDLSAPQLIERLYQDARRFARGAPCQDDLTALVLARAGPSRN